MKLTPDQRKIGMKYAIMSLLFIDIHNKRYDELQQIYETLNLKNNDRLVQKLGEERTIAEVFTRSIYMDAILVIADCIDDTPEIIELADLLYSKRCPYIKKTFTDWEKQYATTGTIKSAPKFNVTDTENHYLHFLFYKSEVFTEPDKILKDFDFEQDKYNLYYAFYVTDKNTFDNALIFCTDSSEFYYYMSNRDRSGVEYVLRSKLFDKYLTNRRCDLAKYLQIEENELDDYIHSNMKSHSMNGLAQARTGIVGQVEIFTKDIIADQNGGTGWYNAMTSTGNQDYYKEEILYIPDVNGLIRNYFKSYVTRKYMELVTEKKQGFTKLTLSRECIPDNYEMVYQTILCMYEMDVLYKMFAIMQKQYYKDFSWEKITNQDLTTRYENIITNLQEVIADKEHKINILAQEKSTLSLQITANNSKQTAPLVSENNKLLKVIENKDSEIVDLKKKLQYQEQFIEELNTSEVENKDITFDLDVLQSKRYLFVGHISSALPELKYKFPNSVFMESETYNLSGVEVDAVVMLIKWMSHSMFYKIKSTGALAQTKIIMFNTKNINTIFQNIFENII